MAEMKSDPKVFTIKHYTHRLVERMLMKYLKPGDSVLDIGTGSGVLAIKAKQHGAGRVLATDIQSEAVELAKDNVGNYGLDIEVRKDYLNFNISERFDITIANLEANQSMEFLQFAKKTMTDDGIIILTWANVYFSDEYIKSSYKILERTEGHDYNVYILKKS